MNPRNAKLLAGVLTMVCAVCASHAARAANASHSGQSVLVEQPVNARDLKALHYMENAHGQLEEWSLRLLSRIELGMGPREREPILDGRAVLQVRKIAVTYSGFTRTPALAEALEKLAAAHKARLGAVQAMVETGVNRNLYEQLDSEVQDLVGQLRTWSKMR